MKEKFEMTKERMKEIRSDAMLERVYEGIENVRHGVVDCYFGVICGPKTEKEYTYDFHKLESRVVNSCDEYGLNIYWEDIKHMDDSLYVQFWIYRYRYMKKVLAYMYSLKENSIVRTWLWYKLQGYADESIKLIMMDRHHPSVFGNKIDDPDTVY